ncbi:MAG: thiamine pyrophosphate-binding protein [Alphaproteobacteria bacterium]|nr:thiamine pyrophosphate-binding protein [Alphaproteobacteria bacterium]
MNEYSGAEALVRMLQLNGVKHIFGLCGDTSLPFYDALFRLEHGMAHILTRDERSAAYMADGYARVSGRPGICEGPSGGGATYLAPGLVEANESCIPILGITSDVPVTSRGKYPLTELDQKAMYRPLTKWNGVADRADQIPDAVRAAFRAMTTGRPGSAHICVPYDVMKQTVPAESLWAQPGHESFPASRTAPDPLEVERAVEALLGARLPVFICGGGVVTSGAMDQLAALAGLLNAPVCTTVSGQGSLSEGHPLCVGVVGANGGIMATREVVDLADLVVFVGCRAGSTTTENWRHPGRDVKIIHIDIDPMVISANYRTHVALVADARLALAALAAALEPRRKERVASAEDGLAVAARAKAGKREQFGRLATSAELPIRPERFLHDLHAVLPRDAVVVADPGTPCPYVSGYYDFLEPGRNFLTNRAHGALGYSMSAATGAWFGRPNAKCVSIMGDGSFGFTVGELETIKRLGVPLLMIVASNSVYGWIKASQKAGYRKNYFSVDFTRTDHARVAEAYGVKSYQVADPADLRETLRRAAQHDGPCLVDIIMQPLEEAAAPVSQWMG